MVRGGNIKRCGGGVFCGFDPALIGKGGGGGKLSISHKSSACVSTCYKRHCWVLHAKVALLCTWGDTLFSPQFIFSCFLFVLLFLPFLENFNSLMNIFIQKRNFCLVKKHLFA